MKWILIEQLGKYVICQGIYSSIELAKGAALDSMSSNIKDHTDSAVCSPIYYLEADAGIGFHYTIDDCGTVQVYILKYDKEVQNENEKSIV